MRVGEDVREDVGRCGLCWGWMGIEVWTRLRIAIDDDGEREGRKERGVELGEGQRIGKVRVRVGVDVDVLGRASLRMKKRCKRSRSLASFCCSV